VEPVSATRTELLNRPAQVDLAVGGRDLLTERRDQLLDVFRRVANVVIGATDALARSATEGRRLLAIAEAATDRRPFS
jgi:vacuolar-type H+-ATPase subunit D/Vma8